MLVFKSRHTPDVKINETKINIGETVVYKLLTGETTRVKVTSEPTTHARCRSYGYEGVFSDDGKVGFADNARIISLVEAVE